MRERGEEIPGRPQAVRRLPRHRPGNAVRLRALPEAAPLQRDEERGGQRRPEDQEDKEGLHAGWTLPRRAPPGHFSDGLTQERLARMVRSR